MVRINGGGVGASRDREDSRRESFLRAAAALAFTLLLTGCLHRHRHAVKPPAQARHRVRKKDLQGIASWYGKAYQGRPTASGEIYNMYAMTAAHRTLPFGTEVRVHDLDNGRSVDVRINDRGPFVRGRIIDLSYAAAEAMGMVGPGTARVHLEILTPQAAAIPPAAPPGIYAVQVGAFHHASHAETVKEQIEPHFGPVIVDPYDDPVMGRVYRVRVGRLTSEATAEILAADLRQAGLASVTYVVRLN
jgi:rare lipoprotein A